MSQVDSMIASMTVADLLRLTGRSVADLVGFLVGSPPTRAARGGAAKAKRTGGSKPRGKVARGGITTDAVFAVVKAAGGPIKAEHVRAQVGGSGAQVRNALQKLAKARKLKVTGKKRGTTYEAR